MAHSPEKATTTLRDVRARPLAKLWMAGKKWRKPPGSSKFAAEGEIGAAEATLGSTIPRRVAVKFLSRHCQNAAGSLLTDGKIQQTPPGLSISNSNLVARCHHCNYPWNPYYCVPHSPAWSQIDICTYMYRHTHTYLHFHITVCFLTH